jgi:hypothetical protein
MSRKGGQIAASHGLEAGWMSGELDNQNVTASTLQVAVMPLGNIGIVPCSAGPAPPCCAACIS